MSPFEKPNELLARGAPLTYAQYPPELHLRLMEATSLAEIKVVLYVFWYTYKFKEWGELKALTLDEFQHGRKERGKRADKGVGLARKNIIAGIKAAVKHHLLYEIVDDRDKARITKYYAIAFWHTDEPEVTNRNPQEAERDEEVEKDESEVTKSDPRGNESTPHPVTNRNPSSHETLPRSEIETPDRDFKINTFDRNIGAAAPFIDVKNEQEEEKNAEDAFPSPSSPSLQPAPTVDAAEQTRQREEEAARARQQAEAIARQKAIDAEEHRITTRLRGIKGEITALQVALDSAAPGGKDFARQKLAALEQMRDALLAQQQAEPESEERARAKEREFAYNEEYNAIRQKERRPGWLPESEAT